MNIFVLDYNPELCAQYHCDKHVVKMILESAQILCSALAQQGFVVPYGITHAYHPCVKWAMAARENRAWLIRLAKALNHEYMWRYRKSIPHKSMGAVKIAEACEQKRSAYSNKTAFVQAMPEKYKISGNPVKAYRNYYLGEKMHFAKWTRRGIPYWINKKMNP